MDPVSIEKSDMFLTVLLEIASITTSAAAALKKKARFGARLEENAIG